MLVIQETSLTQVLSLPRQKMRLINKFVVLVYLGSWTSAAPITMMLLNNWQQPYHSSGGWGRIARADQSHVESSNGEYDHNSDYGASQGGFEPSGHFQHNYQQYGQFDGYQDSSHFQENDQDNHDYHGDNHVHSVPVSEHVEVTKPVAVPVYKEIGVPVPHPVKIQVPHPVAVGVPQPYPVAVPISHPVPINVYKTIAVPVERKVPYPVEKHIPVPIEKPVPITIERHIPVPVERPYPIKIPIYKTIYHHSKSYRH